MHPSFWVVMGTVETGSISETDPIILVFARCHAVVRMVRIFVYADSNWNEVITYPACNLPRPVRLP